MQVIEGTKGRRSFDRITNVEHNEISQSRKVSQGGFAIDSTMIFGNNSATAQYVGKHASIRAFNTNGSVQFVTFGDSSVAVPTITTGLAVGAGQEAFLNSGENEYVRSSNNAVQLIVMKTL